MNQDPAPFHMAQEAVAQAGAFRCTGNQTGHIGDHKAVGRIYPHHPQVGLQGGKGIVGNFRLSGRHLRNQGGFAHVREADQAHVCQ